jgi:histidinol-phosphate aminotransferase
LAAREAVQDSGYISSYVSEAIASRQRICQGLDELGIHYYPSQANFVLFSAASMATPLCAALRLRGVLIRDRSYELAGCVRVTAGTKGQAETFLKELASFWR